MKKKKTKEVDLESPVLFSNDKGEGRVAHDTLRKARIPFRYPPSDEFPPILLVGYTQYTGLRAILEFIESERAKKIIHDTTFVTDDPRIKGKIMQLGHAFTQAVAENNIKLAEDICKEALVLKGEA